MLVVAAPVPSGEGRDFINGTEMKLHPNKSQHLYLPEKVVTIWLWEAPVRDRKVAAPVPS